MDENNFLKKLDQRLDKMEESVHSIDKSLVDYGKQLEYHIKRSDQAEDRLDYLEEDLKPALESYKFVKNFIKLMIPALTIVGIYYKYFQN